MKIACVVLGTRGDVQPMIALAKGLAALGHEPTLYAPTENQKLAEKHGCPFVPFGPEIKKSIREKPEKQKGGVAISMDPREGKKIMLDQIHRLPELIRGADLVLAAGIVIGVHSAADILKIPYRLVAYYPILLGTTPDDPRKSRMMFAFGRKMLNLMMKGYINKARAKYGLAPVRDIWSHWMGERVIMACDRVLNPVKENTAFKSIQTGFMLLPSSEPLPAEVEFFIENGSKPVYIGFGSNPIADPGRYTGLFREVAAATGQRLIVSKGWAGLSGSDSPDLLFVDEVPFQTLFPKVAAAVYHGGTGTLAAIARAGIPQAAFPFMGDQFDNRKQIVRLGLGPETCDFKKMTVSTLSSAIMDCLTNPAYRQNTEKIAATLQNTNGVETTIRMILESE